MRFRRIPVALAVLVAGIAPAAANAAPLTPLASDVDKEGEVQVVDGQAVYLDGTDKAALRLLARPLAGGDPTEVARVDRIGGQASTLFAGPGAGVVWRPDVSDQRRRVLAGPATGPLVQLGADEESGIGASLADRDELIPTAIGPIQVTAPPAKVTVIGADGAKRALPLPANARAGSFTAAGNVGAVATRDDKAVVLFDLTTGQELRRVKLGDAGYDDTALSVSPDGELIALPGFAPGLFYAGPGDTALRSLTDEEVEIARVAGGRVAYVRPSSDASARGDRVLVLDPSGKNQRVYRSPALQTLQDLSFAGTFAGTTTTSCQLLADTRDTQAAARIPSGPCVRTQLDGVTPKPVVRRKGRTFAATDVRCLSAPTGSCRVTVRVEVRRGFRSRSRLFKRSFSVREGALRRLLIPVTGKEARLARKDGGYVTRDFVVRDPGGRSTTLYGGI